ncbi:MAG TPA: toll/interleukin-1 receptor domain-containing protein [Anaerolineales bacterium]|nr:toll/interleukin-1 receptor domain-containing protein [Anaerolineales bacterium]
MTKNIFMSYSRRELGFVDDLVGRLEGEGYQVWLDYRALIPGAPWKEQIDKGLNESDTVLVVVSKAALSSKYVILEWQHFLETKKRVILLVFEAVDLPDELKKFEWVDFRGSYKAGLKELFFQLKQPTQEEHPAPETGFKAPFIVWVAIVLSVIVGLLSLSEIWTLFIPWYLIPLPYRIFKRSFNFTQVQTSLWALPIASLFSLAVYDDPFLDFIVLAGIMFGLLLLFILRSPAMQRWGKPEAIIPKYVNPRDAKIKDPAPVPFYVDYTIQDRVIAEDLIRTLEKYGHPQADSIKDAKAVFVLVSRFKSDTEAEPEKQMVFPMLIQTNEDIAPKLSRIQWIDYRPGVRGLDTIAQLLPNPKELLKALGMRPVSSQTVYSPFITALYYFIIFLAVINIGTSVDYIFASPALMEASQEAFDATITGFLVNILLFCGLAYFMIRGLTSRQGIFSSFRSILAGIVILGILVFAQSVLDVAVLEDMEYAGLDTSNVGISFANLTAGIYFLGLFLTGFVFIRNRRDAKQWFPAKK